MTTLTSETGRTGARRRVRGSHEGLCARRSGAGNASRNACSCISHCHRQHCAHHSHLRHGRRWGAGCGAREVSRLLLDRLARGCERQRDLHHPEHDRHRAQSRGGAPIERGEVRLRRESSKSAQRALCGPRWCGSAAAPKQPWPLPYIPGICEGRLRRSEIETQVSGTSSVDVKMRAWVSWDRRHYARVAGFLPGRLVEQDLSGWRNSSWRGRRAVRSPRSR